MLSVSPHLQQRVWLGYKDVEIVIENSIRNVTEISRSEKNQNGQKHNKRITQVFLQNRPSQYF